MKTKKNTYKWLSTAMVIHLMMPTSVLAAEKVSKEETVYVELDSVGNTVDKISSIWLHTEVLLHEQKVKSNIKYNKHLTTLKNTIKRIKRKKKSKICSKCQRGRGTNN